MKISRRGVVASLASTLAGAAAPASRASTALEFGPPKPFSFKGLVALARVMATRPNRPPSAAGGDVIAALDFDAMAQIRFRPDAALWKGSGDFGAVEFFHLGQHAPYQVAIHVVEDGQARQVVYRDALFDMPEDFRAREAGLDLGFSGFRVLNSKGAGDWLAFQGASYFRAATPFNQYGLSARGLAINTATPHPEEFPVFTEFWLGREESGRLIVHALLESESVVGAVRIQNLRSGTELVQDIDATFFFRGSIDRLGLAPVTSMFWYGQAGRPATADWRPQIHDSDGLAMWTGAGERIWRPLDNPPRIITNAFSDLHPRGFGLMQRDRNFDDYQDDGAYYDRRPSAWVEPIGDWGAGSVQLVEIPATGETDDNIVAFWTPSLPIRAGETFSVRYRLHWCDEEPQDVGVAKVVATREGRSGRPGQAPLPGARKFVVDFAGGRLAALDRQSGVMAVVQCSVGQPIGATAYPVVGTGRWRLMFDADIAAGRVLDLRAYLAIGSEALTESWIFQAFG